MKSVGFWVNQKNGFTLLELVIGVALVGLVGILIAAIYFANIRLFSNQDVAIRVADQNRLALDEITNQIRQSNAVFGGCGIAGDPTTTLKLKLWRIDANQNPIGGTPEDEIVYSFDSNQKTVNKTVAPQTGSFRKPLTNKTVAADIKAVSFSCGAATFSDVNQITIQLTAEAKTFNKTHTVVQEAIGFLRNK